MLKPTKGTDSNSESSTDEPEMKNTKIISPATRLLPGQ